MHRAKPLWYGIVVLSGCGFRAQSDTVADEILRSSGSYEVVRSAALGETLYTDTVGLRFASTFAALRDAYATLGLRLEHVDPVKGELSGHAASLENVGGSGPRRWLECGDDAVPESHRNARIESWYGSRVAPSADGGTVVQTVLRGAAHSQEDADPRPCVSRGTFEAALSELVRRNSAAPR